MKDCLANPNRIRQYVLIGLALAAFGMVACIPNNEGNNNADINAARATAVSVEMTAVHQARTAGIIYATATARVPEAKNAAEATVYSQIAATEKANYVKSLVTADAALSQAAPLFFSPTATPTPTPSAIK